MKTAILLLLTVLLLTTLASATPQGFGRFAAGFHGRGGGSRVVLILKKFIICFGQKTVPTIYRIRTKIVIFISF